MDASLCNDAKQRILVKVVPYIHCTLCSLTPFSPELAVAPGLKLRNAGVLDPAATRPCAIIRRRFTPFRALFLRQRWP